VYHQYVVKIPARDAVQKRLAALGVGTGIHYPVPVHLQPAYKNRLPMGAAACRETAAAAAQILSLPMFPEMTEAQVQQVCDALKQF
jgi:dTDP-4-amino-4,6-dideoxygalactose transaminase